jgi:hypothetical protein
MSDTKSLQIGSRAGGDIVGRDKHVYSGKRTPISILSEKYKNECESQNELKNFIDALMHYVDFDDDVKGLEVKLQAGGKRNDYIESAKINKELFAKRLVKRDLSFTAQMIFVHILGRIKTSFQHKIVPQIKTGITEAVIERAIYDDVIAPINEELEENVLQLTMDEISGMLYFLTGNCHIRWD